MRKRSPVPDVTANIKIKVTNTGKVKGSLVVEATIPEGFTLSSSQWQSSGTNTVRTETDKIAPGETEELSLDVKWNNSETNLGERNTRAEIIERMRILKNELNDMEEIVKADYLTDDATDEDIIRLKLRLKDLENQILRIVEND